MHRFPLRLKIAGFAGVLVVIATGLVALFTVILPWRAKLASQERLASALVRTALPLGIDLRADGAHFDPDRVHSLVANSSSVVGLEIVYALLWDDKGHLDETASSVNEKLLERVAPQLARLYVRDRSKALEILALGRQEAGIRRLPIRLAVDKREGAIGRLDLGLSTATINADLRRSLNRDAAALLASLLFGVLGTLTDLMTIAGPLLFLNLYAHIEGQVFVAMAVAGIPFAIGFLRLGRAVPAAA